MACKCKDCIHAMKLSNCARQRCLLAAPKEGRDDKRQIAMVAETDGCKKGETKKSR